MWRGDFVESKGIQGRRLAILADGHLDFHFGKTAMGVLRYRPDDVVAVIERGLAGKTTQEAIGVGRDVPIVEDLQRALEMGADALLIGVATRGGMIPPEWRPIILQAIEHRMDVISGLHDFLADDPEFSAAATEAGVKLVDVRRPQSRLAVAEGRRHRAGSTVITTVGSDCAVGKMSVALDIEAAARERGIDAQFVATGQTGMLITGYGIPLDRIIGDFMSGAMEELVLEAAESHDVVLVEGQGSLSHPAYSGVTLALIHGSQPDAFILTTMPGRTTIEDYDIQIPPVLELVEMHEAAAGWIKPAAVIGIAVNTLTLSEAEARHAVDATIAETGLPSTDTFRFGADPLVDAIVEFRTKQLAVGSSSGVKGEGSQPERVGDG